MKTTIINFWGSPGTGKSTTAAGLFYLMKTKGYNVELVTEHAKEWAWEHKEISLYNQLNITMEQWRREERLLGKVDYIITDCPLYLGSFYENYYHGKSYTKDLVFKIKDDVRFNGHKDLHFFLPRAKVENAYSEKGRFETRDESLKIYDELYFYFKENIIDQITFEPELISLEEILKVIIENE
jgi:AAA domain